MGVRGGRHCVASIAVGCSHVFGLLRPFSSHDYSPDAVREVGSRRYLKPAADVVVQTRTGSRTSVYSCSASRRSAAPEGDLQGPRRLWRAGITHMKCLWNLDELVGKERFRCMGFSLKIHGGAADRGGGVSRGAMAEPAAFAPIRGLLVHLIRDSSKLAVQIPMVRRSLSFQRQ